MIFYAAFRVVVMCIMLPVPVRHLDMPPRGLVITTLKEGFAEDRVLP